MKKSFVSAIVMCMLVVPGSVSADITDGLIGYWPLDENTGFTTADLSEAGYGFDGTLVGGPVWTGGQFGSALSFDGADDYVLCAVRDGAGPGTYPEELMPETFSVSCWTKLGNFAYFSSFVGNGMDTGADECGFFLYNWGWVDENEQDFGLAIRTETAMSYLETANIYLTDTWYHLAATYDGANASIYIDGVLVAGPENVGGPMRWISSTSGNYPERFAIGVWLDPGYDLWIDGIIDDVGYWGRALSADEISTIYSMGGPLIPPPNLALAGNPVPSDEEKDVARDVVLKWTPGDYAPLVNGHKVYLGDSFDDVSNGAAGVDRGLTSNPEFDTADLPFVLDFDTTYYWRIDEANSVIGWDQGDVWSFTVESSLYPVDSEKIIAAASSSNDDDMKPEKTIDRSGLNDNDQHSNEETDMWLSSSTGPQPTWIRYEFDKIYNLQQMLVWNYNMQFESVVGFGLKDVKIEYSADGTTWAILEGVPEFAQGTGSDDYVSNITVNFDGAAVRYVKITANSNFKGHDQYGLSEVRFLYKPVQAGYPSPDSGATGVGPDVVLGWRAGREAVTHNVHLGTDRQSVINSTVPVDTVSETSYDAGTLDLGMTYYWRIDEVNEARTPTTWEGDLWSFSTPEYFGVDDFEAYNDLNPDDPESNRIFLTWIGGDDEPANGSQVGHDGFPFAEETIVHEGGQSMPFYYNNTAVTYSEASVDISDLGIDPDWTKAGVKALTLYFHGAPDNTVGAAEQMYVKLNGAEVLYDGDMTDIIQASWHEWNIDLSSFVGVNLQNVMKLSIGIKRNTSSGGSGVVYFDDARLYPSRCVPSLRKPAGDFNNDCKVDYTDLQILTNNWLISSYQIVPIDPGAGNLIGHWKFDEGFDVITQDSSNNGNDGLLVDGPTWAAGRPGFGSAISFDGVDDYVVCAERGGDDPGSYPSALTPSTFTISCWARLDNFAYFGALVGNGEDTGDDECGFFLYNFGWDGENGQDFGLSIKTVDNEMAYIETENIYETDTWYNIVATYDGTNVNFYVNGALAVGPVEVGGPMQWISEEEENYPERFSIGAYIDSDEEYWVDGTVDEVRYYDKALTHGQVGWLSGQTASYTQPIHMLLTPPVPEINIYDSDSVPVINMKDFAALAEIWLNEQLWP
jgi:hypothetical protein